MVDCIVRSRVTVTVTEAMRPSVSLYSLYPRPPLTGTLPSSVPILLKFLGQYNRMHRMISSWKDVKYFCAGHQTYSDLGFEKSCSGVLPEAAWSRHLTP